LTGVDPAQRLAAALRIHSLTRSAKGPEPMLDLIYIVLGVVVLGVFALYAVGLRRI